MDHIIRNKTSNQKSLYGKLAVLTAMVMSMSLTGCTALFSSIDTIPASRVPAQFLAEPQANKTPIDVARLRQTKPEFYTLDADDVLGCLLYTSPSPRDQRGSRMPSSA